MFLKKYFIYTKEKYLKSYNFTPKDIYVQNLATESEMDEKKTDVNSKAVKILQHMRTI